MGINIFQKYYLKAIMVSKWFHKILTNLIHMVFLLKKEEEKRNIRTMVVPSDVQRISKMGEGMEVGIQNFS